MIEKTKMQFAYLRMHAESRTCFTHHSLSCCCTTGGEAVQLQREKEKKDGTDRGTTEIQSAYLSTHLVLVVTDYSMSSCCMSRQNLERVVLLSYSRFDQSASMTCWMGDDSLDREEKHESTSATALTTESSSAS